MSEPLLAGLGRRDITPPAGAPMAAFPVSHEPMQPRLAERVLDPLFARAFAFRQGDATIAVCVADVLTFQWRDVDIMRAAFAEATGLPAESLVVAGTHNHHGPECSYWFGGRPDDPYIGELRSRVAAAATEAVANLAPTALAVGAVEADIAYNRRWILPNGEFKQAHANPERARVGPVDPKVTVLRLEREPAVGALLHFAAHPVILTTPNRQFTAAYPGAALRHFADLTGVDGAAFLQGACGDTHPYEAITEDYANVDAMGRNLAQAAAAALEQTARVDDVCLAIERWTGTGEHRYSKGRVVRFEITALRLGPRLAMVFWQGEPFVELSLSLQWRSPFARTVVVGYSVGGVGYVPHRNAYEFGGYGVDVYPRDKPELSRTSVAVGTGELLVDKSCELLRALKRQL